MNFRLKGDLGVNFI